MRESKGNNREGTQLSFLSIFDSCDIACDLLLDRLIREAQNTRYLITKIEFGDLTPKVKNYWDSELNELLYLYSELCLSIKSKSFKYFHYNIEDFNKLWCFKDYVSMAEPQSSEDILAHYNNSMNRLKSAIMSSNPCLTSSGPIIDRIKEKILINSRLLQSFYL